AARPGPRAVNAAKLAFQLEAAPFQHFGCAIQNLAPQIRAVFRPAGDCASCRSDRIAKIFSRCTTVIRQHVSMPIARGDDASIFRLLRARGFSKLITRSRAEVDLREERAVRDFFAEEGPEVVVLAAAKVGGIKANMDAPVEFLIENLQIQNNVIRAAHEAGTRKLLFLGSSCIYPKFAPQPIPESALLSGPLEPTNEPYAIAKIAGIKS